MPCAQDHHRGGGWDGKLGTGAGAVYLCAGSTDGGSLIASLSASTARDGVCPPGAEKVVGPAIPNTVRPYNNHAQR